MADTPVVTKGGWTSKTLWISFLAFVGIVVQSHTGYVIPLEYQAMALPIIAAILRLITKKPIVW